MPRTKQPRWERNQHSRVIEALTTLCDMRCCVSVNKNFLGAAASCWLLNLGLASIPQPVIFPTTRLKHTVHLCSCVTPTPTLVILISHFIFLDHLACQDLFRNWQSSKIFARLRDLCHLKIWPAHFLSFHPKWFVHLGRAPSATKALIQCDVQLC